MFTKLSMVRVTVLIDNRTSKPGLIPEHGLSLLIETPDASILFDTGQSGLVVSNASALGVDLSQISGVVLSHGHFDHTGGLDAVLNIATGAAVYAHPDVFLPHFGVSKEGKIKDGSSPLGENDLNAGRARVRYSREPCMIIPGVAATGQIPRITDFEDTGGSFYHDAGKKTVDRIPDDQALVVNAESGALLLLGCAHAGVVNTMEHVGKIYGLDEIDAVIGGMHLLHASEERLEKTAEALERFNVKRIGPMHCTGKDAMRFLAERFPEKIFFPGVGDAYEF